MQRWAHPMRCWMCQHPVQQRALWRLWQRLRFEQWRTVALGAEGPGLSPATRALLDITVTIPLAGRLESLNVAVAAALVLARLTQALPPP